MLKDNIIKPSQSPWASPITIAKKKDDPNGRFCTDYRKLNDITKTDAYPLPRIDEIWEQLKEARWFSSVDLASGYWQVEMDEKDKQKTSFTCSLGTFEYNVMPFGLKNAPATFQRLMNDLLREYLYEFTVVYLDDIMIYSKTFEDHLKHLERILTILKEANLMIKLKKCKFCEQEIEYLGHIAGKDGLKPDPKKIEKIKNLKPPTNLKEVQSIMGLCQYYRTFVQDFSKIAKPIYQLTQKDKPFHWGKDQQKALDILKEKLTNHPILQYPDYNKQFILKTDASGKGLGAVLSQLNDKGKEVVIEYASRGLRGAERNYPITDLECLAIKWAITERFHKYLIGREFIAVTDHSALKTLMTAKLIKGKRARWAMKLQQYTFKIKHRSGKSNKDADALSRLI